MNPAHPLMITVWCWKPNSPAPQKSSDCYIARGAVSKLASKRHLENLAAPLTSSHLEARDDTKAPARNHVRRAIQRQTFDARAKQKPREPLPGAGSDTP
jgi:hypothetical protein